MNNKRSKIVFVLGLVLILGSAIYLLPLLGSSILNTENEVFIKELKNEKLCYAYIYSSDCAYCNNIIMVS